MKPTSLVQPPETAGANSRSFSGEGERPRLGFLGVGWIGLKRMRALIAADVAEIVGVADMNSQAMDEACAAAEGAQPAGSFEELLGLGLDGVVIATPSALHAEQSLRALARGIAVFCQKPLARTAAETARIVEMSRTAGLPLGVDFSYRHVNGVDQMRQMVRQGAIGELFAIDLTFHNAYGPDKPWFYDPQLSGGGCVIDLGTHLIDLAGWVGGKWEHQDVRGTLWHQGERLKDASNVAEDCAFAEWRTSGGATARLACSWNLSAGQDAVIEAIFYGTRGAVALKNVNGSFVNFVVEHWEGTRRRELAASPDDWSGGAILRWARRLSAGEGYDEEMDHAIAVANIVDAVYGRASPESSPMF